jgi:hypothetical protein
MLPKIDKPIFELNAPSMNKMFKFRPFTVKEEKILLTGQQSGDDKDIILAIKQVINNCAQDPSFDVDDLATFDLEYLFLKLRAKSVNNIIEVSYRDNEDDEVYPFSINLDDVQMINMNSESSKIISVNDSIGLKMKYPSVTIIDSIPEYKDPADVIDYLVKSCIDCIYDENSVYPAKDISSEELDAWLDNLDIDTFTKIREFFDKLPQMYYKIEYTNSKGTERVIELNTLNDFFMLG